MLEAPLVLPRLVHLRFYLIVVVTISIAAVCWWRWPPEGGFTSASLAIASHKFDEGDKLCLDVVSAACARRVYAARVQRMCASRRSPVGPGPLPACLGRGGGAASAQ